MPPPLHQHYSTGLVLLSVAIAILASFTALDLSGRIYASAGRARVAWLFGVALAMGVGIWSMHFVGMLALTLPMQVAYSVPELLASLAFAIAAAAFALWIAVRPFVRRIQLIAAGIVMGIAIAGMHYIGMSGMRMSARIQYDVPLFWLSIAIAVVTSFVALLLTRRLRAGGTARMQLLRVAAAAVMGFAIAGMHYTGMAAAHFLPMNAAVGAHDVALPPTLLAGLVAVGSILLAGLALIAAMLDRLVRSRLVEATLRAEKDAAVETNRAKSEFLSNMSHELRTPLNSIIGFSNIILKNKAGHLSPLDVTHLGRIAANGKHLLGIINEVLDLSKIEAGRMELELSWVNVATVVHETLDEMASQAETFRVHLVAEIPAETRLLHADAARLKQIIINLVSNGVKFSQGGRVTVRAVLASATHRAVRIDVIDTGVGIAKERLETVFEAFRQADASTTRQFGGTGLGLTITRSLAALMGWTIEVTSEVGVGTTFSVVIPSDGEHDQIAPASESRVPADRASRAEALRTSIPPFKVLIIDDEADAGALLQHELEELGCEVYSASSADEGIALARTTKPDLITLDVMMPVKNGLQARSELHADDELCDIPVVVVSVVAQGSRASGVGALEFIEKPITRDKLLPLILAHTGEMPLPHVLVLRKGDELASDLDALLDGVRSTVAPAA